MQFYIMQTGNIKSYESCEFWSKRSIFPSVQQIFVETQTASGLDNGYRASSSQINQFNRFIMIVVIGNIL